MPTRRSQVWMPVKTYALFSRTSTCRARWMVLNSLTRYASAGPQSNLFSRRDTLTLVLTNYPSVGDFSQSHIVMRRLFPRYDTSPLKIRQRRSDSATLGQNASLFNTRA